MSIAVVTTFPNNCMDVYARQMLQSFVHYWPAEIPLMVQLDNDLLFSDVDKILRPQDGIAVGWLLEHAAFVERNKDKEDPTNYRKQPVRFCHKVFAIHRAYEAAMKQKAVGEGSPRYLVWIDADVFTTRPVTMDEIRSCLPRDGDAVAYLGRKDWEHSECGWLAFDLKNGGDKLIELMYLAYTNDNILQMEQWHDSWVFDHVSWHAQTRTNLTEDKPGMDIWPHSPMAAWSAHHKGPVAKSNLIPRVPTHQSGNIQIQTRNALPNEEICAHIEENQRLITNWVHPCEMTDEEIVVVSAGPLLVAEDVRREAGKKIVAVKHALEPLKNAGITPWACILLDPRPHMMDFVQQPDSDVIWFVASQVNPAVTKQLLDHGCTVYGYHASVGAGEMNLTTKQPGAIIGGGSATATRGLFLLKHLGFRNLILYGYDLSFPDKPDLNAKDDEGQPKFLEVSIGTAHPLFPIKRCFWTEPQFVAQFEEMKMLIDGNDFSIQAYGEGIVPFLVKIRRTTDLRTKELHGTMPKHSSYKRLIKWNKTPKTKFLIKLLKTLLNLLQKMIKNSKLLRD